MLDRIREKYVQEGIMQYFMNAGAGEPDVHTVANNANGWTAAQGEYAYAIETYTTLCQFDVLQENKANVGDNRRTCFGTGYPSRVIIPGMFTAITPADGHIVGIYIKKNATI